MKVLRHISTLLLIIIATSAWAQLGINNENPDPSAQLDITASDKGLLIPRLTLTSDLTDPSPVSSPANGLLIFNTGSNQDAGFYYWNGSSWVKMGSGGGSSANTFTRVYTGKFIISSTGSMSITGLPFQPDMIEFDGYANIESYDIDDDGSQSNDKDNYQGGFHGFALNTGTAIDQQTIHSGGSGNSINDISRYSSSTECIGIRFGNQNADDIGSVRASLTSFNSDGFTLNVHEAIEDLVILYTAYRGTEQSITATDVSSNGSLVVENVNDINFGSGFSVTDDGDGSVTVTTSGGSSSGNNVIFQASSTNTSLDVNNNSYTSIPWDNEIFESSSVFTHSNTSNSSRVYVGSTGIYQYSYSIAAELSSYNMVVKCIIRTNGSSVSEETASYITVGGTYDNGSAASSGFIQLNAGDYIEVVCLQDETGGNSSLNGPQSIINLQFIGNLAP